jgi:hypothetical protein
MLENYLKLPLAYTSPHVIKDNKTAQNLLEDQLNLLDQEMKSISQDLYCNDMAHLVAHGRFLEEKFERSRLKATSSLDLPPIFCPCIFRIGPQ